MWPESGPHLSFTLLSVLPEYFGGLLHVLISVYFMTFPYNNFLMDYDINFLINTSINVNNDVHV